MEPKLSRLRDNGRVTSLPVAHLTKVIRALVVVVAVSLAADELAAQSTSYPSRPIKLIVPFAPGAIGDIVARMLGEKMRAELGQPVIVDNRAGGNTVIGTEAAARSQPDGYTIFQLSSVGMIVPSLQANVPYDLERDFTPIMGVGSFPLTLVVPGNSNIHSIADLNAAAQSAPQGINYASAGTGTVGHLAAVLFAQRTKINATHVPYRGNVAIAMQDLIEGRVQFYFPNVVDAFEVAKSGKVRMLAVTSERRLPDIPNVPTMGELGFPDLNPVVWYGYLAPANTPGGIVDRLQEALTKAAREPDVQERLGKFGFVPSVMSAQAFGSLIKTESARWRRVIRENNIKVEN
jgi:tripartite-type tricarboxylate transporter receptor subunit TctC